MSTYLYLWMHVPHLVYASCHRRYHLQTAVQQTCEFRSISLDNVAPVAPRSPDALQIAHMHCEFATALIQVAEIARAGVLAQNDNGAESTQKAAEVTEASSMPPAI